MLFIIGSLKARSDPTSVNCTFCARCYERIDRKSAFLKRDSGGSVSAKISGRRGSPPPTFYARIDRPVDALQHSR